MSIMSGNPEGAIGNTETRERKREGMPKTEVNISRAPRGSGNATKS